MFQSITNYKSSPPQRFSQISKTQKKGYITAQQRIEQIMLAGKNLREYRENQYDFKTESDIDFSLNDPTRSKNFDLADASQLKYAVEASLKAVQDGAGRPGVVQEGLTVQDGAGRPGVVQEGKIRDNS